MAGQVIQEGEEDAAMSDINVVPLTDVMLVLLIVFLIAIPVVVHQIPVTLPKVVYQPTVTKPENVSLSVRNGPGDTCGADLGATKDTKTDLSKIAGDKSKAKIKTMVTLHDIIEY